MRPILGSNPEPTKASVTPWRSSVIAATLKRRLALGDEEEVQQLQAKQESSSPIDRRPALPARKKNQTQKNFEDIVAECAQVCPQLGQACRLVGARMRELPHADVDREMESVNKLIEVAMLKGIQKLEECEEPGERFGASVSAILHRVEKEPVSKQLDALVGKVSQIVALFAKLADDVDAHEAHMTALLGFFDEITRDMAEMKHAAEDFLSAVVKRHDELASKASTLDKELEEVISMRSPSPLRPGRTIAASKHLSMTLDVLQSGDPKILQMMQDRRHTCEMQRIAAEEFDLRAKELELRKAFCVLCEVAGSKMEDNVAESRLRAFNNRCKTLEDGFEEVRDVVGQLEIVLSKFGELQKQRAQNAQEKLDKLIKELDEHKRLYTEDEAPTERKDLEGRIAEFTEVIRRSKQAVGTAIQKQVELWSVKGVPDPVKSHVLQRLGPVIRSMPFVEELSTSASSFFAVEQFSAVDALRIPFSAKMTADPFSGYDSDDFFETDESSSTGSVNHHHTASFQPTADIGLIKEDKASAVQAEESGSGGGCVIM